MSEQGYVVRYKPDGDTIKDFMRSNRYVRGLRGPIGSGKSVACCVEIFRRASQQEPSPRDGLRKSRWAVIRNTNPQLKTTTIKTWLRWFPEDVFGPMSWSPPFTHRIRLGDIDLEVIFLSMDKEDDVRKLLSLDLTGVWINEAREIPKEIVDGCTMRTGRFPDMVDGGPSWYGVIMDTNAMSTEHWWPILSGEVEAPDYLTDEEKALLVMPPNWEFWDQPPAMIEIKKGDKVVGYKMNPKAENTKYLDPDYYKNLITGKRKSWIDTMVLNRLGVTQAGRPVYQNFNEDLHVSKEPLQIRPEFETYIGTDFGFNFGGVIFQKDPRSGRYYLLREYIGRNKTTYTSAQEMVSLFKREFEAAGCSLKVATGDPTGDNRSPNNKDAQSAIDICNAQGLPVAACVTNDPTIRIETVENLLGRLIDGKPALLIDPSCTVMIGGFRGGYKFEAKKNRTPNISDVELKDQPLKNDFSHPHDAFQYGVIGAGEAYTILLRMSHNMDSHQYDKTWSVNKALSRKSSRRERRVVRARRFQIR